MFLTFCIKIHILGKVSVSEYSYINIQNLTKHFLRISGINQKKYIAFHGIRQKYQESKYILIYLSFNHNNLLICLKYPNNTDIFLSDIYTTYVDIASI
jgi:hypothetical protein